MPKWNRDLFRCLILGCVTLFWKCTTVFAVCTPSSNPSSLWPYDVSKGSSPSCASTNGGTNNLGTAPQMCKNDPTSIRLETSQGKAECLVATLMDCKIPIHDFVSLDYDFHVADCLGFWGCPLWMTPDVWQWGKCSFLGIYHCLIICLTTFCTTL